MRDLVFQNNGVENIVKSMLNFPDNEDIQENVCFGLQHFVESVGVDWKVHVQTRQ